MDHATLFDSLEETVDCQDAFMLSQGRLCDGPWESCVSWQSEHEKARIFRPCRLLYLVPFRPCRLLLFLTPLALV